MMKKILCSLFLCCLGLVAQNTITLTTGGPSPVNGVSLTRVGNQGTSAYYYWVIANWGDGTSQAVGNYIINAPILSATNYVKINWTPNGANSYTVLQTSTPSIPSSCTCAVVIGTTSNGYSDTGGVRSSYSYSPAGSYTAHLTLTRNSFTQPIITTDTPWNTVNYAKLPNASSSTNLIYLVVDASSTSTCTSGGGTNTPALCWSNGVSWVAIGGGGGGGGSTTWTVTPLGNITGAVNLNVGSTWQVFTGTLVGNVTLTASGAGSAGFVLQLTEDATGNRTLTCDSSFASCGYIDPTANNISWQGFVWNGTAGLAYPQGAMITNGGTGLVTSTGVLGLPTAPDTLAGLGATQNFTGVNQFTGTINASNALHFYPRIGTVASITGSTCTVGEIAFATDATAGQNWYFCTATNTWTQQLNTGGGGGGTVTHNFGGTFGSNAAGSSTLVADVGYTMLPANCNLQATDVMVQPASAVVNFKLWRVAAGGTALPTSANNLNTSGIQTNGTNSYTRSTTLTDFSSTAFVAKDLVGVSLTIVSGNPTWTEIVYECQ